MKQRSSPVNWAAVMQSCSHEHKAVVMQRSGDDDKDDEMR